MNYLHKIKYLLYKENNSLIETPISIHIYDSKD